MNEALPGWLGALREDAGLAGDLGLQWLDAEGRRRLHAGATEVIAAPSNDDNWRRRGIERMERCVPVALGPERGKRLSRAGLSTALFFDPMRPEHVSLSLCASMSPLTWAEAPATVEGVRALFARCLVAEGEHVALLPKRFRTIVDFGDADRAGIEEALTGGHPMVDDASWYSAHDDDPWLGREDVWGVHLAARLREVKREHPSRVPSASFRTLCTRSVIKIEEHPFGLWVVELRYAPSPDAAAVRWVNEVFHAHFPEDVPVDLIGSGILQGGHTFARDLDEREARGEIDQFLMVARLALAPGEAETSARLRAFIERFEGDPATLGFLANAALHYRDEGAVFDIAARTAGSELAEEILAKMSFAKSDAEEGTGEGEDGDEDDDLDDLDDLDDEDDNEEEDA